MIGLPCCDCSQPLLARLGPSAMSARWLLLGVKADDELSGVTGWVIHDLRRTARSLMARAGIRPDVAERVLGHAFPVSKESTTDIPMTWRRPTH
jgi:integrase